MVPMTLKALLVHGERSSDEKRRATANQNIRGATLDHIYEQATAGQAKFSPAALNKAIKGIGGIEKLEQILGKKGAAELKTSNRLPIF